MACFRDPMHVPGSGGEYSVDVFAKSEKAWKPVFRIL